MPSLPFHRQSESSTKRDVGRRVSATHGRSRRSSRLRQLAVAIVAVALAAPTFGLGAATATPVASSSAALDQLVVSVVGSADGGGTAAPVTLQATTGEGSLGDAMQLPTEPDDSGNRAFTLRTDADQQGALQQSADRSVVTLGGYDAAPGTADLNGTTAPTTQRVVASLNEAGDVDTTTTLNGAFSERHIRGAVALTTETFFVGGHGGDATTNTGGVLRAERGSTEPTPLVSGSSTLNNARVPVLHEDRLYVSSDRDGYNGVALVGPGTAAELTAPASLELVAEAPPGAAVAHDFSFVDDSLYVGYTEGDAAGIVKYTRISDSWEATGTLPGQFWGLTARAAGEDTVLYAVKGSANANELVRIIDSGESVFDASERVIAQADSDSSYRGVAFAPGYEPSDAPIQPDTAIPEINFSGSVANGLGTTLGAVLESENNPVARGRVSDPEDRELRVEVESSAPDVVADDDITVEVSDDGSFTLSAVPTSAGSARVTVTAVASNGDAGDATASASLEYRVMDTPTDPSASVQFGMSDASAAVDAGDGHALVADDDSNEIRLFGPDGGFAVAEFDPDEIAPPRQTGEAHDFEGAARIDDTVYWVGSLGNSRSGNIRPDRDVVVRSEISGTGADTTLEFTHSRSGLRSALVDWDTEDGHGLGADYFGFAEATADGSSVEGPNSLNVEGATIAPDDSTLWLGFRSPLLEPADASLDARAATSAEASTNESEALIIPVPNIDSVVTDATAPVIGDPIRLDLGGRAIRDLVRADDGSYLILAGSANDDGNFAAFRWSGSESDAPERSSTELGIDGWSGSYESAFGVASTDDEQTIRVLQDNGTSDLYGSGEEAQDLNGAELRAFIAHDYTLQFADSDDSPTPPGPTPGTDDTAPGAGPGDDDSDSTGPGNSGHTDPSDDGKPSGDGNRPGTSDTESDADDSPLASTGAAITPWLVGAALVLVLAGATVWVISRRRRG